MREIRTRRRGARHATALLVALAVSAAGLPVAAAQAATQEQSEEPLPTAADGPPPFEGLVDVGDHRLHLDCEGSGSPTVIYLHGAIFDENVVAHANADPIQRRLADTNRVCLYDRANVGLSDDVRGAQQPKEVITDLEVLLRRAGVEPPLVLLGASFGGLLATIYAAQHPRQVDGMVMLDSMVPGELRLEKYWPVPEELFKALHQEDRCCTLERISHWRVHKRAARLMGNEPDVPLTYLASEQEPRNGTGHEEYDKRIVPLTRRYVERYEPGEFRWVDAPHFMEPVIPGLIAAEVRQVIRRSR
jgi:pimeloyl-ACP methyl ester carboxylesterase